jgi:hypothetical protein
MESMAPPHPVNRLLVVTHGLRALAAEIEEIQGEPAMNLLWWADEIDRAIVDLRQAASGAPSGSEPSASRA